MTGRRAAAVLVAALGLTASCALPPPAPSARSAAAAETAAADPMPCETEYRAFLDLADLARRYGASSGVFLDPLGDMFEELDDCLAAADGTVTPSGTKILAIRARRAARSQDRAPISAFDSRLSSPLSSEASFSRR